MKNREIKFRGYNPKAKVVVYKISVGGKPIDNLDTLFKDTSEDGFVWMQYTGLKDKNGVEIYESDIVECNGVIDANHYNHEVGVVVFDEEHGSWMVEDMGGGKYARTNLTHNLYGEVGEMTWKEITEILGNIHEHPELLKLNRQ